MWKEMNARWKKGLSAVDGRTCAGVAVLALGVALAFTDAVAQTDSVTGKSSHVVPLPGIHALRFNSVGSMDIRVGDTESLTMEGDEAVIAAIQVDNESGLVSIRHNTPHVGGVHFYWCFYCEEKVHYVLQVKSLDAIRMDGSGDIHVESLKGDHLELSVEGSGNLRAESLDMKTIQIELDASGDAEFKGPIHASRLKVSISGSGDLSASDVVANELEAEVDGSGDIAIKRGAVRAASIAIHGSGDYSARSVAVSTGKVKINGSGDVDLGECESLDVKVNGSGDVHYRGRPRMTIQSSGSGSVDASDS